LIFSFDLKSGCKFEFFGFQFFYKFLKQISLIFVIKNFNSLLKLNIIIEITFYLKRGLGGGVGTF
jgi:hypothetical protein